MNLSVLREDEVHLFENNETQFSQDLGPILQTFNIKCEERLSPYAKSILLSWKGKPFYCANEDILYLFKLNRTEQNFLLRILHSMAIFLQNGTCTNLFDISIYSVNIAEAPKSNHVTNDKVENHALVDSVTFKLKCHVTRPTEKSEIPW
uniref:Uncharacterized protein n=1 Tax=Plagiogrammopsis vanheurckii TaxID=1234821 RepID=A0A2U9NNB6_9STRA|nr:hypothetical protein ycf88 [Plagiogrammopsis vanheurckii]AWT38613.1 hypothetical protein ycf88 [Plagiogrammopsis vanheurckii]